MLLAMVLAAAPVCAQAWDCSLDDATKTCSVKPDGSGTPGGHSAPGLTCACSEGQCVPFTVEAVPCRTWRDCSVDEKPFPHATSSKKVPRALKRKVRPCVDSERDAICDETHTCKYVVWKC